MDNEVVLKRRRRNKYLYLHYLYILTDSIKHIHERIFSKNTSDSDAELIRQYQSSQYMDILGELMTDDSDMALLGESEEIKTMNTSSIPIVTRKVSTQQKDSIIQYHGRITDQAGEPLPGVTASVASSAQNTLTDINGYFNIRGNKSGTTLIADYIGFKQKVMVSENDSIGDITLENENYALNEVITIDYGTQKRKIHSDSMSKTTVSTLAKDTYNKTLPEPVMGMKRFIRKIERSLLYPVGNYDSDHIEITVQIFISNDGSVKKIHSVTPADTVFLQQLENKIKEMGYWSTNNLSTTTGDSFRQIRLRFTFKD